MSNTLDACNARRTAWSSSPRHSTTAGKHFPYQSVATIASRHPPSLITMLRQALLGHIATAMGGAPHVWRPACGSSQHTVVRSFATANGPSSASGMVGSMEEAASRHDLDGLLSIVESSGESFDGQTVAAALRQVESCTKGMAPEELQQKLHGTKTFQMLADMAVSSAARAPPEVLARTIGVLGRLNFQDEMVFDSLARHLMPGVKQLKAEQISDMVEGLKRADHSPSVLLLDEVHERLSQVQHDVPQEQARAVEEGLRSLGHDASNLPNSSAGNQAQPDRIKYT